MTPSRPLGLLSTARFLLVGHPRSCAAVLLLVFAAMCVVIASSHTLTYDEGAHLAFGQRYLDGALDHADMQKMPITALNAVPLRVMRALGLPVSPENRILLGRLPTIACGVALGWLVFLWSGRLNGAIGGLLSLFLFVFCPTSAAHGSLITTDMYCACFSVLAAFTFVLYLEHRSWWRLVCAATSMGVAQMTKHTALLLLPALFATFVVRRIREAPHGHARAPGDSAPGDSSTPLRKDLLHGLGYVLICLTIINAGYGFKGTFETLEQHRTWLASNQDYIPPVGSNAPAGSLKAVVSRAPLPLPRAYVEAFLLGQFYNETGRGHGPIYLLGDRSPLGWSTYFPVAFALKMPLPTLGLLVLAVVASGRARRLRLDSDRTLLLALALTLFTYFSLFCTAQIGVRYLLPILPFLYVFAGGLGIRPPGPRKAWLISLLTLLCWLPVSVLSYFPHELSYFNEVCWDRLALYKYLADSNLDWGQDGHYLEVYLKAHQGQSVAVNPESPVTGTVIVSVNNLVGVMSAPTRYQWLRDKYQPTSRVAYSWLVYDVPALPLGR